MLEQHRIVHMASIMATAAVLLFALCGFGCAGDYIEYTPLDPGLVGKIIHFKEEMAYINFSNKKDAKKFGFIYAYYKGEKITRVLVSKYEAYSPHYIFQKYKKENIKDNMSFMILASYWNRGDWLTKEFAPDVQYVILRDENHILSSYMISGDIKDSLRLNTDFGDF